MLRSVLVVVLALCALHTSLAQSRGVMTLEKGTHFMVAFPPVTPSLSEEPLPTPLTIICMSDVPATVRIRTAPTAPSANAVDVTLKIVPTGKPVAVGSVTYAASRTFALPSTPQKIVSNAFEITSDAPISVTTRQQWTGNGEDASQIPVPSLGTAYHVFSLPSDMYGKAEKYYLGGFILVTAVEDATTVTFKPTVTTVAGPDAPSMPAGQTTSVVLQKGQTFYVTNVVDTAKVGEASQDLTGTAITSTKPISVVSGHLKGSVFTMPPVLPLTGASGYAHFVRNNVHDVMFPDANADTSFIVVPQSYTARRTYQKPDASKGVTNMEGDVVRILALENNTYVHRLDSAYKVYKNVKLLRAGEYYTDSTFRRPTKFISTRPVLVAQYGKSWANLVPPVNVKQQGDHVEGHPTVEAGMPTLTMVPSIQQWTSGAVFNSAPGMDNFVSIAYRTADAAMIMVDGKAISTLNGNSVIPHSEYSVYRDASTGGNHIVSTTDPSVRVLVMPHASLDGMQMGRAFASHSGFNAAVPGTDSIVFASGMPQAENIACGAFSEAISVRGTTGLYSIYPTSSTNYTTSVADFNPGDTNATFSVQPIDKTIAGRCIVRVVTRSGNYAEKLYTYTPDTLSVKTTAIDTRISIRVPYCFDVSLKSMSTNDIVIRGLLHTSKTSTLAPIPGGQFDVTPLSDTTMQVCVTSTRFGVESDTLTLDRTCFNQRAVIMKLTTVAPTIVAADVAFGSMLPTASSVVKSGIITNQSDLPLLIDSIAWQSQQTDAHFQIDAATPTFPLIVDGKKTVDIRVRYTPNGDTGVHQATLRIYSNSTSADSLMRCSATSTTTVDVADEAGARTEQLARAVAFDDALHLSCTPHATVSVYTVRSALVATIIVPEDGLIREAARSLGLERGLHLFVEHAAGRTIMHRVMIY